MTSSTGNRGPRCGSGTRPFRGVAPSRSPASFVWAPDGEPRIGIRVEIPEVWDAVRVDTPPAVSVLTRQDRARWRRCIPTTTTPAEFVVKRNGIAVQDESVSLADARRQ